MPKKEEKIPLKEMLFFISIFSIQNKELFIPYSENEYTLFKVDGEMSFNILQDMLERKIVSNKRKSLFLNIRYSEKGISFVIFQENARVKKILTDTIPYFEISKKTSVELSIFIDSLKDKLEIEKLRLKISKQEKKLKDKILILTKEELEEILLSEKILELVKTAVLYTVNHYWLALDNNIAKIDDAETLKKVEEKDKEINEILEICYNISEKHNLKIPRKYKRQTIKFVNL